MAAKPCYNNKTPRNKTGGTVTLFLATNATELLPLYDNFVRNVYPAFPTT